MNRKWARIACRRVQFHLCRTDVVVRVVQDANQEASMSQSYDQTRPFNPAINDVPPPNSADARKKMGRRALIAAGGLAVVGVGAAEAPKILDGVGQLTGQELTNAINFGRQQLAKELQDLEGVGVGVAAEVADITGGAVDVFVIPVLDILAGIGDVTLEVAKKAVELGQGAAGLLNIHVEALKQLDTIFTSWQTSVAKFPQLVKSVSDTDTKKAHTYLLALQQKLEHESASK